MTTRKLTGLYSRANRENIFIHFAYYEDGEWNGVSEECEITPGQLYDLLAKANLLTREEHFPATLRSVERNRR